MRSLLIAAVIAGCGPVAVQHATARESADNDAVADAGEPDAARIRVGKSTVTASVENGRTVLTVAHSRIYCRPRTNQTDIVNCFDTEAACGVGCRQTDADACFLVALALDKVASAECFDRISDCESVRAQFVGRQDFVVDQACSIMRADGDE